MKKFFLSAILIIVFVLYANFQKSEGKQDYPVISPPKSAQSDAQPPVQSQTNNPTAFSPTGAVQTVPDTPTPIPTQASRYRDGIYTGDSTDAYYGNVQVQVTISNGKITDVRFLDYPHDRMTSQMINMQAMPYLKTEAIVAQSANVDIVTGATQTSMAFQQSLQSALDKAK